MAHNTAHYRMVDRVLDGQLESTLQTLYAETGSWEEVARRIYAEHTVIVTGQTLRRWARQRRDAEATEVA